MSIPDLTQETYDALLWIIGAMVVCFAVWGALYFLGDILAWFRQALADLWDNSIGQWFE